MKNSPEGCLEGFETWAFDFNVSKVGFGNINQKIEYASANIVNRKNVGLNVKLVISSKKSDVPCFEWSAGIRQFTASPLSQPTSQDITSDLQPAEKQGTISRNSTPSLKRTARNHRILTHHTPPKHPQNASTIGGVTRWLSLC